MDPPTTPISPVLSIYIHIILYTSAYSISTMISPHCLPTIIWCYGRSVVFLHLGILFGLDAVLVAVGSALIFLSLSPSFSASFENGTESNQLKEFDKQHRIFTSLSLVNFSKYQCLSTFSLNFCSPIVGAALSPWRGMNLVLQHQEWSCWWGLHNSYDACSTICKTSKLGFCLNSQNLIVFCWKKMVVMFF